MSTSMSLRCITGQNARVAMARGGGQGHATSTQYPLVKAGDEMIKRPVITFTVFIKAMGFYEVVDCLMSTALKLTTFTVSVPTILSPDLVPTKLLHQHSFCLSSFFGPSQSSIHLLSNTAGSNCTYLIFCRQKVKAM